MFVLQIKTAFRLKNYLFILKTQRAWLRWNKSMSGSEFTREVVRVQRDTKLQKVVFDDQKFEEEKDLEEILDETNFPLEIDELKAAKEPVDEFNSLIISKYFEENYKRHAKEFPDVVEEIDTRLSTLKKIAPLLQSKKLAKEKLSPQYPFKKLTPIIIDKNYSLAERTKLIASGGDKNSNKISKFDKLEDKISQDRGFFVYQEQFKDEYETGTALTLPQDKFSLVNRFNKGVPMQFRHRYGPDDAVEEIEFQMPYQSTKQKVASETFFENDWTLRYGVADPNVPAADKNCPACGAQFHCQNASLPGFIPAEYFHECSAQNFADVVCRRCYLLKTHNFLLNVNVSKINYEAMLSKLKLIHEVLIILIVDMLDFPCSMYRNLPELIGYGKHVIVVGNKVDLLPPDPHCEDYLTHYRHCLVDAIRECEFFDKLNIMRTLLISAKTGYNIENLITYIQTVWENKGDIYLVGCTNSGKSTLFNAFLQSDMCKIRATDLVERATTSIWPGTTMNLLKFPLMNPTPYRLLERQKRLNFMIRQQEEEEYHRQMLLEETGDSHFALLQGYIGRTFEVEKEIDLNRGTGMLHMLPESQPTKKHNLDLTNAAFTSGKWCYDTPGTISDDQSLNILTLDELVKTMPHSIVIPRTAVLHRYNTLFIAGLARIDCFGPIDDVYITVFSSDQLPLNVVERREATQFYERYFGTKVLGVPFGNETRLRDFPLLVGKPIRLVGFGFDEACADIVLSSVGWISVTAQQSRRVELRVWTPGGRGIYVRPSLVPFANMTKGRRIFGTNVYKAERSNIFAPPIEEHYERRNR